MAASDIPAVFILVRAAFARDVAPGYGADGVQNFLEYVSQNALALRLRKGHQTWVAEQDKAIVGVLQLRLPRHLCMLFVSPDCRYSGIARSLWALAVQSLQARGERGVVTVNSSPYAVEAYRRFGFTCDGGQTNVGGIVSQPMVFALPG